MKDTKVDNMINKIPILKELLEKYADLDISEIHDKEIVMQKC